MDLGFWNSGFWREQGAQYRLVMLRRVFRYARYSGCGYYCLLNEVASYTRQNRLNEELGNNSYTSTARTSINNKERNGREFGHFGGMVIYTYNRTAAGRLYQTTTNTTHTRWGTIRMQYVHRSCIPTFIKSISIVSTLKSNMTSEHSHSNTHILRRTSRAKE